GGLRGHRLESGHGGSAVLPRGLRAGLRGSRQAVPAEDDGVVVRRDDLREGSGGSIVAVVLIADVRHAPEATSPGKATFPLYGQQNFILLPPGIRGAYLSSPAGHITGHAQAR